MTRRFTPIYDDSGINTELRLSQGYPAFGEQNKNKTKTKQKVEFLAVDIAHTAAS